jgi:hypothetical protein
MATRMQQRRGTAAQWISTNAGAGPVLNAGEIGWESDTNRFKIGDGVNNWANLDYFADTNSTTVPTFGTSIVFEGATADSYETTLQVTDPTADRTITLPNVTGTVITTGNLSDITDIGVFTSTIVMEGSTANDFELTLSAGDPTADRTITFPDATGTVALTSDIAELSQDAIDTALTAGTGITKTYNDVANTLTLAVDTTTIQARVTDVSDTEIGYLNGVTSGIQTQLDARVEESLFDAKGDLLVGSADNTPAKLTVGTNGYILTANSSATNGVEWAAAPAGYSPPTLGSTQISSGATVTTIAGLTLSTPTVSGLTVSDASIVIEGATANEFETTLTVVDPTADRIITFPDATTTVVGTDTTQTLTNKTIDSPTITSTNGAAVIHGILLPTAHGISFEGATDNDFETILTVVDPTADRTITFPDATGTVALAANVAALAGATFTGAVSGTDLTLSGNLTVNGTTTNINSTNLVVEDKNIILADVETPTDTTADGGGITLKGATDKTFNWVDATDSWTSSEHINLASGKSYYMNGTLLKDVSETLANKTLSSAVATTALTLNATAELRLADTDSTHYVGFKSPATVTTNRIWTLPSTDGTAGQALSTDGSGNLSWATSGGGAAFSELMLIGA